MKHQYKENVNSVVGVRAAGFEGRTRREEGEEEDVDMVKRVRDYGERDVEVAKGGGLW